MWKMKKVLILVGYFCTSIGQRGKKQGVRKGKDACMLRLNVMIYG